LVSSFSSRSQLQMRDVVKNYTVHRLAHAVPDAAGGAAE
jgi:hypothetical protein